MFAKFNSIATARKELVKEVERISIEGVPGSLAIMDANSATSVISSPGNPDQCLMAAAHLGNGKVIAFSHPHYPAMFQKNDEEHRALWKNMRIWLTGNERAPVVKLDTSKNLLQGTIYIHCGGLDQETEEAAQQLSQFVMGGGAFVYGFAPWIYHHYHKPGHDICDCPITKSLLYPAGMSWQEGYLQFPRTDKTISLTTNCADKSTSLSTGVSQLLDIFKCGRHKNPAKLLNADKEVMRMLAGQIGGMKFDQLNDMVKGQLAEICRHCQDFLQTEFPDQVIKATKDHQKHILSLSNGFLNMGVRPGVVAWGVAEFPGMVNPASPRKTFKMSVNPSPPGRNPKKAYLEWHSTGCYLAPGETLQAHRLDTNFTATDDWLVQVGAHSDNNTRLPNYDRYPEIFIRRKLPNSAASVSISSAFGGLVYIISTASKCKSVIKVAIDNVVEAPLLDVRDPKSVSDWPRRLRDSGAPWGEIQCESLVMTVPVSALRAAKELTEAFMIIADACKLEHDIAGTKWWEIRRDRIVTDKQIVAGYMHAGYPIFTHLDIVDLNKNYFVFDVNVTRTKGLWGLYHEMGHNRQVKTWNYDTATEVTVNIFTLAAMERFTTGFTIYDAIHLHLGRDGSVAKEFLKDPKPMPNGFFQSLCIFSMLATHFGWEAFRQFFRIYENDETYSATIKQDIQRRDGWLLNFSKVVGMNVTPIFDFWNSIAVSDDAKKKAKSIEPAFLPDSKDRFIAMNEASAKKIASNYPKIVRKAQKVKLAKNDTYTKEQEAAIKAYKSAVTFI